ncbi:MAG: hypothetical protein IJ346_06800 [Clostridia bacterium]|nr:hypothetical protein [Clostridia bacterium]
MKLKYESPKLEIFKFTLTIKAALNKSNTDENTGDENIGELPEDPFG